MPNSTPLSPRPRAPYAIYRGDDFLFLAGSLSQLHDLLRDYEVATAAHQHQAQVRRQQAFEYGGPWHELPAPPPIIVLDNRRVLRPDLASSWSIRRHHSPRGPRGHIADRFVDLPWDGEIRPRGAPVPGTGRRIRYGRKYFRYPSTQAERRLSYPVLDEGEPHLRPARRSRAIPNAWDDLPRRGHEDRSWKRYRAKQWAPR